MLRRAGHRVRQFFGALRPRVSAADRAEAYAHLPPSLRPLFESMVLRDQQHGIHVLRHIRAASRSAPEDLLAAALIHDCGKGRVLLWHRVLHVLAGALAPSLEPRLASDTGAEWRRALYRLVHHPALGAALAADAGASSEVVRLIRDQDEPAADERLALLQAADQA
jgi:hypothetical protein